MLKSILPALLFALVATPALAGSVSVVVDLSDQKMYVKVNGWTKYQWDVSTARKGYRTPLGEFKPTRMHTTYYSKKYHNSPMPYSIFFYGGYAIHGTTSTKWLGRPASHGCVRLHPDNAEKLFSLVEKYGKDKTLIEVRS